MSALQLDHVEPSISAADFFAQYVAKRCPVIIRGLPDDPIFHASKWTDLDYLANKAGDTMLLVEPMHPAMRQFGTDVQRVPMHCRDFLASLRGDGPHHYLTTQYANEDEGVDTTTVLSPPTDALAGDFPRVPRLMGNLFLQQTNLWIGRSADGSSSGLHHDFHDNLYCLLQGRKRFVLLPPQEAQHLYPHGALETVHANGLISYVDAPVRADGLSARTACTARVAALERKIDALPLVAGNGKGKGRAHTREKQALLDALDEARDEVAQLALDTGALEYELDDFDVLVGGLEEGDSGADGDDEEEEKEEEEEEEGSVIEAPTAAPEGEPTSFSRIPTAYLHKHLGLPTTAVIPSPSIPDFPDLARTTELYVVELAADEALYLPASWWHEVTSSSAPDAAGATAVHMAFNYWFYPPDALESFEQPYKDTLVWDYLREKASAVEAGASETARGEKRKQEDAADKDAMKKLRR